MAPPVDQSLEVLPYEYDEEVYLESNPDALVCEDHDVANDSSTLAVNLPPPDEINYTPGPTEYVEVNETLASVENRRPANSILSSSGLWNPVTQYTDQIYAAALERSSSPDRPLLTPEEEEVAVSLLDVDRNVIFAAQNRSSSPDWPLLAEVEEARAVAVADAVDRAVVARVAKKAPDNFVDAGRNEGEDNCPLCDHHNEEATTTPEDSVLAVNAGAVPVVGNLPTDTAEEIVDAPNAPTVASQVAQPPVQGEPQTAPAVVSPVAVSQPVANAATASEAAVANSSTLQRPVVNGDSRTPSGNSRTARNNSGGPIVAGPAGSLTAASAPTIQPVNTIVGSNWTLIPPANVGTDQRPVVPTGAVIAEASQNPVHSGRPEEQPANIIDGTVRLATEAPVVLASTRLPRTAGVEGERGRKLREQQDGLATPIAMAVNPNLEHDQAGRRDAAQPEAPSIVGVGTSPVVLAKGDSARNYDGVAQALDAPLHTVAGQGNDAGSGLGGQSGNGDTAEQVKDLLALSELEEPTEADIELGEELDPSDFSPSQVYIG